jgi:surface polysaccharide O-acyltransferase-like enzyme
MKNPPEVKGGQKVTRKSSIEMLRIIAMVMIVMHHFSVHSIWPLNDFSENNLFAQFLAVFGKAGVGIFFIITGYFLAKTREQKITPRRVLKICLPVWFYSIVIFIAFLVSGRDVLHLESLGKAFFPLTNSSYWFITTYLIVYLLTPYIKILLDKLRNKQLLTLLLILVTVEVIPQFFSLIAQNGENAPLGTTLLAVLYVIIGYAISRFERPLRRYTSKLTLLFLGSVSLLILSPWIVYLWNKFVPHVALTTGFFWSQASIISMVFCFTIFTLFSRLEFRNRLVNYLGGLMLGIYLIHDNFLIRDWLWQQFVNAPQHLGLSHLRFVAYSIAIILAVFVSCLAIEAVRQAVSTFCFRFIPRQINRLTSWLQTD